MLKKNIKPMPTCLCVNCKTFFNGKQILIDFYFVKFQVTKEGEVLPFFQQELSIGADGGQDRLMFIWPTTMLHKIDRHSPLYALSAQDMLRERFEIVVMLGEFFFHL